MRSDLLTDFLGLWQVEARTPTGDAYEGTLTIHAGGGDSVRLDWEISSGRYVGIGLAAADSIYVACGDSWAGLTIALFEGERMRWARHDHHGDSDARIAGDRIDAGVGAPFRSAQITEAQGHLEAILASAGSSRALAWRHQEVIAIAAYEPFRELVLLRYWKDGKGWRAEWSLGGRAGIGTEVLRASD